LGTLHVHLRLIDIETTVWTLLQLHQWHAGTGGRNAPPLPGREEDCQAARAQVAVAPHESAAEPAAAAAACELPLPLPPVLLPRGKAPNESHADEHHRHERGKKQRLKEVLAVRIAAHTATSTATTAAAAAVRRDDGAAVVANGWVTDTTEHALTSGCGGCCSRCRCSLSAFI